MEIRFIDLFAGIGGIRKGLEEAVVELGAKPICVFTSEIKPHAISVLKQNHPDEEIHGDITQVSTTQIPDFDILCAGFPCQAFSAAGSRKGFADTRGTLFFDVERILADKKPKGFILENVEGLVNHDGGNTLKTIIEHLQALKYNVSYRVLNAKDFGVPQDRKRIYIVGSLIDKISLEDFPLFTSTLGQIIEQGQPTSNSKFVQLLLSKFSIEDLQGKSIKDKRGGSDNIHSWDLELKGPLGHKEKAFLNVLMTERRKKKWAIQWGIDWMDGMPLTKEMISEFYIDENIDAMLEHLVSLGYIKYEHPKKIVEVFNENGQRYTRREYDTTKPKGYNIVAGKLSFEVSKILPLDGIAPTLVATDVDKLYLPDNNGLRTFTLREGLRLFGYPEDYKFDIKQKDGFDLLGNTVVVPVIKAVASRLLNTIYHNS